MALSTILSTASLSSVREGLVYSGARTAANARTAQFSGGFTGLITSIGLVSAQELALDDAVIIAGAVIDAAAEDLRTFVSTLSHALLVITEDDRTAAQFVQFFGTKRPSDVNDLTFADALEFIRPWPALLAASAFAALSALAAQAASLVAACDKAVTDEKAAEQAARIFALTGDRAKLIDEVNAVRKATYGDIGELPHLPGGETLAASFADRFFEHESRPRVLSSKQLSAKIDAHNKAGDKLKTQLAAAQVREAAAAQEKADRAARDAEIAAANKVIADARAKKKAAKASPKKR